MRRRARTLAVLVALTVASWAVVTFLPTVAAVLDALIPWVLAGLVWAVNARCDRLELENASLRRHVLWLRRER